MSTRVDMTPMVDLAFLLLTFFMLTTTFAKPTVMQLTMPVKKTGDQDMSVPESGAMTVILGKNHRVHYFFGLNSPDDKLVPMPELHTTTFAASGIRQVLLARQAQRPPLMVLIKPSADSKYQDLVDILDEMNITNQKKYALVNLAPADLTLLPTL